MFYVRFQVTIDARTTHVHTTSRLFNSLIKMNGVKFKFESVVHARTNRTVTSRKYIFFVFFRKLKILSVIEIWYVRSKLSRNMNSNPVVLLLLLFINEIAFSINEKSDLNRESLNTKNIFTYLHTTINECIRSRYLPIE